jgi:hypothetical protein
MSLILVANLLNNAKQLCIHEADMFYKRNNGVGRNCPLYGVLLFSVNSFFIEDDLSFVSKDITSDVISSLPDSFPSTSFNELRFTLETSIKYKLPSKDFSLPRDQWTWDTMLQYVPDNISWVKDVNYNTSYVFKVNANIQPLQPKYQILNNKGVRTSIRVTNKNGSQNACYVGKVNLADLELLDINNLPINALNRSLLTSVIDQNDANIYQSLINNRTVTVPTAYELLVPSAA